MSELAEAVSKHQRPTLESIPQLPTWSSMRSDPYSHIIDKMQITRFQAWGFVVYRCTYSDDAAWQRYMNEMKKQIQRDLEEEGLDELLLQYLQYTVIEDPNLEGASKNDVRKRFRKWVASLTSDEIGVDPGEAKKWNIARFSHCVYVDQKCLDTLAVYEAWRDGGENGLRPYIVCALIDVNCTVAGKGQNGFPEIEGCKRQDPGWMYLSLHCIPTLYNEVSISGSVKGHEFCVRPPRIYPGQALG